MIQEIKDRRIGTGNDAESYSKVFIVCGEGALLRKCLICERVFSRQESFEHSKFPCQPPAPPAN
jgi:hypothetical protein